MKLWQPWFLGSSAALFVMACVGCHDSSGAQPNSADLTRSAVATAASTREPVPVASASALPRTPSASVPSAALPPVLPASPGLSPIPEAETEPPLFDEQGKALAQTDQRPTLASAFFQKHIAALASAIISGDVQPALSAFFPLVGYQQVKDVAKPERDYKFRLLANFKRDLLEYHHALGAAAAESKFEGITVSEKDAKWMPPGSEGNKLGYFRVLRSRLRFTLPTGRSREFELTSLISWRGEWYVVHLHGFK